MQLHVSATGTVRCVYSEAISLRSLGNLTIQRASHVEPIDGGQWTADLSPVGGPALGPYADRSAALWAEQAWLDEHWPGRSA